MPTTTTTFTVTTEAQLNAAIGTVDAASSGSFEIDFGSSINLGTDAGSSFIVNGTTVADPADLLAINLNSGVSLTINGETDILDGQDQLRGLLVYAGAVLIENLTIQNAIDQGGPGSGGGGGGAGLGGGVFVASAGNVTLGNVTFTGNLAVGGDSSFGEFGGGGGLNGTGGAGISGGGGGVGVAASGGGISKAGGRGIIFRAGSGGSGGNGNGGTSFPGGIWGGGGSGGGTPTPGKNSNEGGGGGVGGVSGNSGGTGGFGGGGASGVNGGFAGGGGGGYIAGAGGFGGGGGAGYYVGGAGGFGAGSGNYVYNGNPGGGGGGLGAGANVFVQQGGKLTILGGVLNAGTVTPGKSQVTPTENGQALGNDLFIQGGNTITLAPPAGQTLTLAGEVTDTAANGGTGAGSLLLSGAGTVALTGTVNIGGGVTIASGTLKVGVSNASTASFSDAGGIAFTGAATLDVAQTAANEAFTTPLQYLAVGDAIDLEKVLPPTVSFGSASIHYQLPNGTAEVLPAVNIPFTAFQLASDGNGGSLISLIAQSNVTVSTEAQLNAAIAAADAETSGNYTITMAGTITEGTDAASSSRFGSTIVADPLDLFAVNLHSGVNLTFGGQNPTFGTIDGAGLYRGLFVYAGNVTLQNLGIQHTLAKGGTGGASAGGGAGLGGALFVAGTNAGLSTGGTVTLGQYVTFTNNSAVGGAGGGYGAYGGGGGLGGAGGQQVVVYANLHAPFSYSGGGGGVGAGASGGTIPGKVNGGFPGPGATGVILGAAGGGSVEGYNKNLIGFSNTGGAFGGGGAGNGEESAGGGGVGATHSGGFGGGAGGGGNYSGGFGGGGGGGYARGSGYGYSPGGSGGWGGGGGRQKSGGFGGGIGEFGGGGGLGAGGNIFVQQGGSLVLGSANSFSNGTVTGGLGLYSDTKAVNGSALGSGIFLQGNETIQAMTGYPLVIHVAGDVTDGGSGAAALIVQGPSNSVGGSIEFGGTVNLGGGITILAGAIHLDSAITSRTTVTFAGAGEIDINAGGVHPFTSTVKGLTSRDSIVIANATNITDVNNIITYTVGGTTSSFSLPLPYAGEQVAITGTTITALPVVLDVGNEAELQSAIAEVDSAIDGTFTIAFTGNITEGNTNHATAVYNGATITDPDDLFALNIKPAVALTIDGHGFELNGAGRYRGFLALGGDAITIQSLTIFDALARGGSGGYGGGGGAGLGGGLFVAGTIAGVSTGASVKLNNVTFTGDGARGGYGFRAAGPHYGGGGGMGGGSGFIPEFASSGLTGGGGLGADAGGAGFFGGSGAGFALGAPADANTGAYGGGGVAGAGGGIGGTGPTGNAGGNGGFGGGGGGNGGNGGFGGGGGGTPGGSSYKASIAGFGGGAGVGGTPGFGGGASVTGAGGGGLAAGGDVFVQQGGTLTIANSTLNAGTVTPGTSVGGVDGEPFGSGIFLQGTQSVTISADPGTTHILAGDLADDGPENGGTGAGSLSVTGGGTVVAQGSIDLAGFVSLEGTTLRIGDPAQGPAALRNSSFHASQGIDFIYAGVTLDFEASAAGVPFNVAVNIDGEGDIIHLAGLDPSTFSYDSGTGEVNYMIGSTPQSFPLALFLNEVPYFAPDNGGTDIGIACYVEGTRILTADGEVAVEDLREGDLVPSPHGSTNAIRWIGHRVIDLDRHPDPDLARPIRIRADAIAAGVPRRDLWVSPDHAIYLDGLLIAARLLRNGATILRDNGVRRVRYFHVELDRHGIMLAEGLPAESYLDTGNRGMFENAGEPRILHPDVSTIGGQAGSGQAGRNALSCAPLGDHPARVEPIWRRLAARAAEMGHRMPEPATTTDPALRLRIDGIDFAPLSITDGRHRFVLPRSGREARLVSLASAPCDLRPWIEDHRSLGVYVKRIVWLDGHGPHELPLGDASLNDGWWGTEHARHSLRRWTNGDASLPLPPDATEVEIDVAGGMTWLTGVTRPSPSPRMMRAA